MLIPSSDESHHPSRKGYQQDALFAGNKDELSPVNKVHRERGISPELWPVDRAEPEREIPET
jgi:hypothetical protein